MSPGSQGWPPSGGEGLQRAVSILQPLLGGLWESEGFLPSIGNSLILAFSSFPVLGWIWFVFIQFILLMYLFSFLTFHWFHCSVFLFTLFPLKLISWEWKSVVLLDSSWFVGMSWSSVGAAWALFQSPLLLGCCSFTPWWISACHCYKSKPTQTNSRNNYLIARQLLPELNKARQDPGLSGWCKACNQRKAISCLCNRAKHICSWIFFFYHGSMMPVYI